MSEVADVTIKYVNLPKEGKKWGNIKTNDDVLYWAMAPMLRQFTENEVCKIEFDPRDADFKKIVKKIGGGNGVIQSKQNVRQRMDPIDAMGAFVTVVLEAFVRAGKVSLNRDAIALARKEIEAGYSMSHNPQHRDDMDDDIPY